MSAKKAGRKGVFSHLYVQVLIAIAIGVVLGYLEPDLAVKMKPLGDAFIKLIKMLIAPIIFCTVVAGINSMDNMKQAGRVGVKALAYFIVVSALSLLIGLTVANTVKPGVGMNIDPATLSTEGLSAYVGGEVKEMGSMSEFLLHIIPSTTVGAFAEGEILQVLFFALLFAAATMVMGETGKPVVRLIDQLSHVFFTIIGFIMKVAPLGAFGAIAFTVGAYGIETLLPLMKVLLTFYLTCLIFVFVVLSLILRAAGLNIFKFLGYIKDEIFIVLGTSSSETVLPRLIDKLTALGCQRSVVGMVLPTGYSFNLDGTAIYLTMAAIFLAQATNTPITLREELILLGVMMLTSKGAAGVTGSAFVVLAATLGTVGNIPVASIALILGIDRFMSEGRAITNMIGNSVATVFIARFEGALDLPKARRILDGRAEAHLETQVEGPIAKPKKQWFRKTPAAKEPGRIEGA